MLEGLHIFFSFYFLISSFFVAGGGGDVVYCLLFEVFFVVIFLSQKYFFVFNVQNNVLICIAFVVKIFKNEKWAFGLSVMKIDKGSKDKIDHLFSKFANFSEKLAFFTP